MIRIFYVKYLLFALDDATNQPSIAIPTTAAGFPSYILCNEAKNTQLIYKIIDFIVSS